MGTGERAEHGGAAGQNLETFRFSLVDSEFIRKNQVEEGSARSDEF